jgi:hypothetical protein
MKKKDYCCTLSAIGCIKRIVGEGSKVSGGTRYPYEHPCKFLINKNEWRCIYIYLIDFIVSVMPGN